MARITDIEDIKDSLNEGFGRIRFGDGAFKVYTPIVVTFYTSGHKNLETYRYIKEYLARKSKMYVIFNFANYMPQYASNASFVIEGVERTPYTITITCCKSKHFVGMNLFPYNDFFEAFESKKWKLTTSVIYGIQYVEFNETK